MRAGRAIENYLDIAHLAFVHDGTLGRRDAPLVEEHQIEQDAGGFYFAYVQEEPEVHERSSRATSFVLPSC